MEGKGAYLSFCLHLFVFGEEFVKFVAAEEPH